jgi:copper chaperone CopZ
MRVSSILSSIEGVSDVSTDLTEETVSLVFDDEKTNIEIIKSALKNEAFEVKDIQLIE